MYILHYINKFIIKLIKYDLTHLFFLFNLFCTIIVKNDNTNIQQLYLILIIKQSICFFALTLR